MKDNIGTIIWGIIAVVVFALLWRKGLIHKFSQYVSATKEELRKCSWPTISELKGSTVVVLVAVALLGCFTVVSDLLIALVVQMLNGLA